MARKQQEQQEQQADPKPPRKPRSDAGRPRGARRAQVALTPADAAAQVARLSDAGIKIATGNARAILTAVAAELNARRAALDDIEQEVAS